jgi:hypothetical protein
MPADDAMLQQLSDSIALVAKLAERGDYADALTVMVPWADAPLEDMQKTVVAHNVAHLYVSMQRPVEALAWFDWGLPIERPLRRTLLAEAKAALLAQRGRRDEAAAVLQGLVDDGSGDDAARQRIAASLAALRGG